MSSLVFLLEEASAKYMLEGLVPKLVPKSIQVRYITFSGKRDLEKQMEKKIRYWMEPDSRFIILIDKDAEDCSCIKDRLLKSTQRSGKAEDCLVRIACHELESFFLGDLAAVAMALNMPELRYKQKKRSFRNPDTISNAAKQLKKITEGRYHKVSGSREIAPYLTLDGANRSHSFGALIDAIRRQISIIQHS